MLPTVKEVWRILLEQEEIKWVDIGKGKENRDMISVKQ